MIQYYPAIIDINPDAEANDGAAGEIRGHYGVTFPDVPGCYAAGDTVGEAIENARMALAIHLEVLHEEGRPVPSNSGPDKVLPDSELKLAAIAMIPVSTLSKVVRVNISMESDLLDRIDAVSLNRSAFLAEGARALLDRGTTARPERVSKTKKRRVDPPGAELRALITK